MGYTKEGVYVQEDDSVAGRVAQLQTKDSPLIRNAVAAGTRGANARGLQNTSIGIGAATAATLGTVVPIASQDAQQAYGKNIQFEDQRNQKEITAAQIAAGDRTNFANSITSAGNTFTQGIANTLVNSKIPANTRAAAQADIARLYEVQQQQFAGLFGAPALSWGKQMAAGG
jgi:hypothetical protein